MQPLEIKKTIAPTEEDTLCNILAKLSGLPKARVKHAMQCGAVWLQNRDGKMQRTRRATTAVRAGDQVAMYYDPAILNLEPPIALCIQDYRRYSIWLKPAGMMTQGSRFGDHCALTRRTELYFRPPRKVFPVHRIDRETSGLVIMTHDRKTAALFSEMFQKRQIEKRYQAVVVGRPVEGDSRNAIDSPLDGRPAITQYTLLRYDPATDQSLVEIQIVTGRRHQIRRHFDMIGHPVVGDPAYGRGNKNQSGLQLVAYGLKFKCPLSRTTVAHDIDPQKALS